MYNPDAKIPVWVKLRRCTSTIENLIQDFFSRHKLPLGTATLEHLLQQGKLLLLLDGLNELPEAFGTEAANFRDRYRRSTSMIVSTRDLSAGGTLGITKTLKMLPLTEPQMQEFVRGYLGEDGDQLFQRLKGDRLRKFAETPLLLWMLCRVFVQNGQVPANLGLAFREFTQLYDQQIQEDAPADSRDQWPKLLRHLAFALMHDKELVEFRLSMPRDEAENLLTDCLQQEGRANVRESAERWLQDLLDYHLLQPVRQPNFEEHVEFSHQLIQEYYSAEYLLRLLPELSDEQLKRDYLNLLKWTEPIALMLALVDVEEQALRVVKLAMDDVDLILGARLAGEVQPAFQATSVGWIDVLAIPMLLKCQCWATSNSDQATSGLLNALGYSDFYIQCLVSKALGQIGSHQAIPGLLSVLEDPDSGVKCNAAYSLGQIGSDQATPGLISALEEPDPVIRASIVHALGQIGSNQAISGLLNALKDSEDSVCNSAIEALGRIRTDQVISELLNALEHSKDSVRSGAAIALGQIGSDRATSRLLEALEDSSSDVCSYSAEALGKIGSEQAVCGLIEALRHPKAIVRKSAVGGLGASEKNDSEIISKLSCLLKDQSVFVRLSAAEVLGATVGEQTVLELIDSTRSLTSGFLNREVNLLVSESEKQALHIVVEEFAEEYCKEVLCYRACHQLSQMTTAARWTALKKLRAVLS